MEHWDKAYTEYDRRFGDDVSNYSTGSSLLLIATSIEGNWTSGEELRKIKCLIFPVMDHDGATLSALFMVYMRGPEHGAADADVSGTIYCWTRSNPVLEKVLNGV